MVKTWRAIGIETEYCNHGKQSSDLVVAFCAQKIGKEAGGIGSEGEERPGGCGKTGRKADSPDGEK